MKHVRAVATMVVLAMVAVYVLYTPAPRKGHNCNSHLWDKNADQLYHRGK